MKLNRRNFLGKSTALVLVAGVVPRKSKAAATECVLAVTVIVVGIVIVTVVYKVCKLLNRQPRQNTNAEPASIAGTGLLNLGGESLLLHKIQGMVLRGRVEWIWGDGTFLLSFDKIVNGQNLGAAFSVLGYQTVATLMLPNREPVWTTGMVDGNFTIDATGIDLSFDNAPAGAQ